MEDVNLNELTNEELDNLMADIRAEQKARKAKAKENEKARKEELKAANKAILNEMEKNATVRFILKGEETEGTLDKVTDKRFVVVLDTGDKRAIMFDKLITDEVVDNVVDADEAEIAVS